MGGWLYPNPDEVIISVLRYIARNSSAVPKTRCELDSGETVIIVIPNRRHPKLGKGVMLVWLYITTANNRYVKVRSVNSSFL